MISQQQTQKQQLKILPQQIQLLNLYFLNTLELEQKIKNELEENPFLEIEEKKTEEEAADKISKETVQDFEDWDEHGYDDIPDYKAEYHNYFESGVAPNTPIAYISNFKEEAKQQLRMLSINDKDLEIADYLVEILNSRGMMDRTIEEVADDMSFHFQAIVETERIMRGLQIVQGLEPVGLGARSIQECLLMQLNAIKSARPGVKCAINLIKDHYTDLMHRQFDKIQHALKIDDKELKSVLNLIGGLKFYPVNETSNDDPKNTIIPDFIITNHADRIQVTLYSSRADSVFVNQSLYDQLASQVSTKEHATTHYIRNKLHSAQWFVNSIRQREDTMLNIMRSIVNIQYQYFKDGNINLLKPMVLRNIAEMTGMDISTVSRITSNKYADTHFGMICLKSLFSEGIADKNGEVISNKVIQSVIKGTIESEDRKRPFTDQQLVNILVGQGYNIARRTVTKYREQMQIPIAQIRSVWA